MNLNSGNTNSHMILLTLKGGIELTLEAHLENCGLEHAEVSNKKAVYCEIVRDPHTYGERFRVSVRYGLSHAERWNKTYRLDGSLVEKLEGGILKYITRDVSRNVLPFFLMTAAKKEP